MKAQHKQRKLILHFDVNKTIIMKDTSNSLDSINLTVCQILGNCVWGHVSQNAENGAQEWTLAHKEFTEQKPDMDDIKTFRNYMDIVHPLKQVTEIPNYLERKKINEPIHQVRHQKYLNLFEPNGLCHSIRHLYEQIIKSLTLPASIMSNVIQPLLDFKEVPLEELHEDDDLDGKRLTDDQRLLKTLFNSGQYYLVPSFFKTLMYLKKTGRDFAIVFRTFGSDLDNTIAEYNKFCSGEHPCYNGKNGTTLVKFDGKAGTKDMRIVDRHQKGLFYRQGFQLSQSTLVTGTLERAPSGEKESQFYQAQLQDGTVRLYAKPEDQYFAIMEVLKKRSSMAIQDHYEYWAQTDFSKYGGKLMYVDQNDFETQHIFFDDNAGEDDDCVVDVKDPLKMKSLSYKKTIGKYVFKVEPHRAILENDYFIKIIEKAESSRDLEIQKIKLGYLTPELPEENEDDRITKVATSQDTEWEQLQKLPDSEYLLKTILPVLYQGMQVVDMMRPEAPLEFLASYLLKNQQKIQLPPKTHSKRNKE